MPAVAPRTANPADTAAILYTSGTTDRPKGAQITHGNLRAWGEIFSEVLRLEADDIFATVLEPQDLRTWIKERLSAYKVPRRFSFVDALPKGPTGKILKRAIDTEALSSAGTATRTAAAR